MRKGVKSQSAGSQKPGASLVHDIRNCLNIMGMSVSRFEAKLDRSDYRRKYLVIISRNIKKVNKLVDKLKQGKE